ncbi:MAG TPA: response regulator [Mycobacteriales bacterium]|nr:response regulator [Mycobacteriales bacterium]
MSSRVLLIVDDSSAIRSVVGSYMSDVAGWQVVTAADAGTGLLLAVEHEPAAIVLDNRMPGGDGIEVLPDLRRTCPEARIVMHTSEDVIDLRDSAARLGADALVPKGRPLHELAAVLGETGS